MAIGSGGLLLLPALSEGQMNPSNLSRTCPLCGSSKLVDVEPSDEQIATGVTCVLHCECGAIITLSVQKKVKPESPAPKENA